MVGTAAPTAPRRERRNGSRRLRAVFSICSVQHQTTTAVIGEGRRNISRRSTEASSASSSTSSTTPARISGGTPLVDSLDIKEDLLFKYITSARVGSFEC